MEGIKHMKANLGFFYVPNIALHNLSIAFRAAFSVTRSQADIVGIAINGFATCGPSRFSRALKPSTSSFGAEAPSGAQLT